MIKKLFLTAAFALSGTQTFCEEAAQPTQKEEVIAQLTTGPVSAKTEKLVRKLLKKYGIDTSDPEIVIAQPSSLAKELNPVFEFPTSMIPPYKMYLINESYFNKLSHPEKEIRIAFVAMHGLKKTGWKIPGTNITIPKTVGGMTLHLTILLLIIEALIGFGIFKLLGNKTKLSKKMRIIIAVSLVLAGDVIHEIWKQKTKNPMAQAYETDKKLVEIVGSPEGYITYLKRMQKDIKKFKKSANPLYWQNYEATLAPRIKYLESLKK